MFFLFKFQVVDNQVIKYTPPETFVPKIGKPKIQVKKPLGCIIVGAISCDPQFVSLFLGKINIKILFIKRIFKFK